jgi:hypothetical protein
MELKINNKYNIGDIVYVFYQEDLFEVKIDNIVLKGGVYDFNYEYVVFNGDFSEHFKEKYIYSSPEEYFRKIKIHKFKEIKNDNFKKNGNYK